jgi:hypothetical protein
MEGRMRKVKEGRKERGWGWEWKWKWKRKWNRKEGRNIPRYLLGFHHRLNAVDVEW